MNRPFCAFGILLTLLVLATIGVSSSSRSTQVRVIPKKAIEKQTRRCGSGTFVFVLPEVASPAVSCSIASVQIELADGFGSFERRLDAVDCRSHGDAIYDYAVCGDLAERPASAGEMPGVEQHVVLNAEELVAIFNTLECSSRRNCSFTSRLRDWFATSPRAYLPGLKNWAVGQSERLPLVWLLTTISNGNTAITPPITWADYSSFADRVVRVPPSLQPAKIEPAADEHVQSGHWLLHSAASSLNHLALVLQAAADRLQQPAELAQAN